MQPDYTVFDLNTMGTSTGKLCPESLDSMDANVIKSHKITWASTFTYNTVNPLIIQTKQPSDDH